MWMGQSLILLPFFPHPKHQCIRKALTQMLFSKCSTSRPLKTKATSTSSLRIWVEHPILILFGEILIVKHLLRLSLTLFLRPSPFPISMHLTKLGLLNLLGIHHRSRDINIMNDYCRMTLFFNETRHPNHKLFILSLQFATKVRSYFKSWVNLREYSFILIFLDGGSWISLTFSPTTLSGKNHQERSS